MTDFPSLEEFDAGIRHTAIENKKSSFSLQNEVPLETLSLKDTDIQIENTDLKTSKNMEESFFFQEWKLQKEADIEKRDEQNRLKKEERIEAAKKAIESFYETYNDRKNEKVQKAREKQKEFLSNRDNAISGTLWERVVKLLNLSDGSSGLEDNNLLKFKELLLSLENDSNAPGANNN
ncbi:hypothetical protein PCANB_000580 [Pneumocystis canis]|nr:hypothetical protein PCANB_000580 [Pneumocystis canis]